jgi:CBS domain-containing protein
VIIFNKSLINGSIALTALGIGGDEDDGPGRPEERHEALVRVSKIEVPHPGEGHHGPLTTTVFRKTSVSEAARTMRRNDFGQLPVVDSRRAWCHAVDVNVVSILAQ